MTDTNPTPTTEPTTAPSPRRPRRRAKVLVAGAVLGVAALTVGGVAYATGGSDRTDDAALTGTALERASDAAIAEAGGGTVTETATDDDGTTRYEVEVTLDDGTQVEVDLDDAFAVVRSETDRPDDDDDRRDDDRPLTGDVLAKASAAAIAEAGGGAVTETSTDDDGTTRYEVEVTLEDGTQVDVDLDDAFAVVRSETDRPGDDD